MPVAAKLLIQVVVGLAPEMPIPERCRTWGYTSADFDADLKAHPSMTKFHALCDEATAYAREQMDPTSMNFVRLDWIWL